MLMYADRQLGKDNRFERLLRVFDGYNRIFDNVMWKKRLYLELERRV